MKVGFRKSNLKKSIQARTTTKMKKAFKSVINPVYGKNGIGYIKDPKKAIYNKFYNKTSVGLKDTIQQDVNIMQNTKRYKNWDKIEDKIYFNKKIYSKDELEKVGKKSIIASIILILLGLCIFPIGLIFIILGIFYLKIGQKELKESKK